MNKPAVTRAQLKRTVETLEAMGKVVGGVLILPGGGVQVLIGGAPLATTPLDPDDADGCELAGFRREHGYG